jgi:hypothetical protein
MIKPTEIAYNVAKAIKQDADIDVYCKSVFGKGLRVVLGMMWDFYSKQNPDDETRHTPCIVITPSGTVQTGNEQDADTAEIILSLALDHRDKIGAESEDPATPFVDADGVEITRFMPELDELTEKIVAVARWNVHGAVAKGITVNVDNNVTDFNVCSCFITASYYQGEATLDDIETVPTHLRHLFTNPKEASHG